MEERVLKKLMASIKCSFCGQQYEPRNIEILGHNETLWFLKVLCSSCHTRSLVAAIIEEDKLPELLTDLTEAERRKFELASGIEVDDVLQMHAFLKEFEGDFSRLFGRG